MVGREGHEESMWAYVHSTRLVSSPRLLTNGVDCKTSERLKEIPDDDRVQTPEELVRGADVLYYLVSGGVDEGIRESATSGAT